MKIKRNKRPLKLTKRAYTLIIYVVSLAIIAALTLAILNLVSDREDARIHRQNVNAVTYMEDQAMQEWHAEYGTYAIGW
jgi:type II secretory pathway pseudopilin PulG